MADEPVIAFIMLITDSSSTKDVLVKVRKLPEVEAAYVIYGDWDILIQVKLAKLSDLTRFIMDLRNNFPIKKSSTLITLND
jgi:DNA-binding Lrp family transcriptional regulator